ncbi:MAG: hypothetical protein KAS72_00970 [Phycisphaerales bacterium]|nr:hypothetical protein [Phycisphaerales bacterium]
MRRLQAAALLTAATCLAVASTAQAQSLSDRIRSVQTERTTTASAQPDPRVVTMTKLMQPVTLDVRDQPLEDIITFLSTVHGIDILTHWASDAVDGLDPEQPISLTVTNLRALSVIELILDLADTEYDENAWQFTDYGALEIGPKSELNKRKVTVIYPVADLLLEIPRHDDAPDLSLQSALQQGKGGGGGNIFSGTGGDADPDVKSEEELADDLIEMITNIVEYEQWIDNGGDGGTIQYFRGSLIVRAPDYMHRRIDGYPWWPSYHRIAAASYAPRYVSLGVGLEQATVLSIAQSRVSAVTGSGQVIQSGP